MPSPEAERDPLRRTKIRLPTVHSTRENYAWRFHISEFQDLLPTSTFESVRVNGHNSPKLQLCMMQLVQVQVQVHVQKRLFLNGVKT